MRLTQGEQELYDSTLRSVEQGGSEERRHEATHIREQLALHGSYADACARIEQYAEDVRRTGAPHVRRVQALHHRAHRRFRKADHV